MRLTRSAPVEAGDDSSFTIQRTNLVQQEVVLQLLSGSCVSD